MSLLSLVEPAHFLNAQTPASQRLRASELMLQRTVGKLGLSRGTRVLEVGTGSGLVAGVMAAKGAAVWTVEAEADVA